MTSVDRSYSFAGGRTGFLLIHGLGGTPIELKYVAKGLARQGFTVHCCQLAGHCGSEADLLASGWPDWYASASAALDRIRQDCDTVIVGGLSMGAVLALHLAALRPNDVQGLALYAPTLWYDGWSTPWYRFLIKIAMMSRAGQFLLSRLYRFVETEPYGIKDPYIRAVVIASLKSGDSTQAGILVTPGEAVRQLCLLVDVVRPELPSIKVPAFLVQAREDDLSSLKNSEYLQRHLGGLVDALILDDSYHIVTVDRQRDLVIAGSVAFATLLADRLKLEEKADDAVRPLEVPAGASRAGVARDVRR